MRQWTVGISVVMALGFGAALAMKIRPQIDLVAVGTRAPAFHATNLATGRPVSLADYRGRPILLNLWATWCPPCREEMPSMERLYGQLHDRDFQLLAVSQDEDGSRAVEPFVRQLGITFPVLIDPERQVGERYGVWGYPETFIIDRNGYVVERVIGPRDWATPAQRAALEALIAADGDGANASAPRGPS